MGSGLTTTVRTSLLERVQEEKSLPLDLSDILTTNNNVHRNRAYMIEEVKRIRSLIKLAESGRRMSIVQFSMEQNEPIALQIKRVRNLARDKQRVLMNQARINKKKNFEAKLRKIPVRKTTMETSARSNVIAATTTDTLTRGSTGFIGSNTGRVSIASKFWTDRSGKNTTNTNEYDDNNDSDETVDLDLEIEPEPEQSSHRVVIVDDSKAYTARLKRLIQRVLFGTSVEIVAFSNIQQATTYLSSSIATLVFMDNIFPSNTTGLEASERLFEIHGGNQQRIILMSGENMNCIGHYGLPIHAGYPSCLIGMLPKTHVDMETVHHACRVHCIKVGPSMPILPQRPSLMNWQKVRNSISSSSNNNSSSSSSSNDNSNDNSSSSRNSNISRSSNSSRSSSSGSKSNLDTSRESDFVGRIHINMFHQGVVLHRGLFSKVVQGQSFKDKGIEDEQGKKHVMIAIKILRKDRLIEENHVDAAKRELDFMRRLSHAHIIECLGWDMDSRRIYLFMEFAQGGDVLQHINREDEEDIDGSMHGGPLTEIQAQFWSAELLDVLEYLHDLGIVFRDIKTENLIILPSGHIKLIDFGFAKHIGFGRTFTRCGSPEYVSPEIVLNRGHGLQTDIWSFGVTMYEMIAGYLPFGDEDTHPLEMSRDITCGNYICEEDLFSSTVRDLLSNCLNIDPQKRDDPGALKNHAWFQKQFLPESKINKGEQGWKPTRILSTNRAVPKGLIPIVGSDNDDRNFEKYPDSIEETALVVAGNNELQFQGFGG